MITKLNDILLFVDMFYESHSSPSVTVKSEDSGCGFNSCNTFNSDQVLDVSESSQGEQPPLCDFKLTMYSSVEQVEK